MAEEVVLRLNISKNGPENRDTRDFQNGSRNQEQTLNIYFWIIAFKCFINKRKEANCASISKLLNIYPKGFTKYALRWFSLFYWKKNFFYIFLFDTWVKRTSKRVLWASLSFVWKWNKRPHCANSLDSLTMLFFLRNSIFGKLQRCIFSA